MSKIRLLSSLDALAGGDNIPVYSPSQGDDRRASLTTLVGYLATAFSSVSASSYIKVPAVSFASLPSAVTAGGGARATVSDSSTSTFNAAAAGGGANIVPVFSDGLIWRVG